MMPPIPEDAHFFAVYRAQMQAANRLIWQLRERPIHYAVFIEALCAQQHNEGYLRLEPKKLASDLGIDPELVLDALRTLQTMGILIPHRDGWGVCDKLAINPHLAWKGRPDIRNLRIRSARPIGEASPLASDMPNVILMRDCIVPRPKA
ncbi:hypothetical protein H261_16877 [Paramagnetospirillum caucaseum]|uniref:Uncharacterized protein n=1 Tax=Paramagnetospirillum caucaseum TaxID=1244869 RepID=M2Z306_9PROT|nr:hypothetical protein [Paramagnetospirillum caucaseum]EME68720.1 hypothetical protein H261_16877 [Paramagnetospirillum caucaseum]